MNSLVGNPGHQGQAKAMDLPIQLEGSEVSSWEAALPGALLRGAVLCWVEATRLVACPNKTHKSSVDTA